MSEYKCKFYKQVKQISYDYGSHWQNTDLYRRGDLYEYGSDDCNVPHDYSNDYLTFRFDQAPSPEFGGPCVWFNANIEGLNLYYSVDDGETWTKGNSGCANSIFKTVKFKMDYTPESISGRGSRIGTFDTTANVDVQVEGNIMSLVYGDNFREQTSLINKGGNIFERLFSGITELYNAENLVLPATSVPIEAYQGLFYNCQRLVNPPKVLPATYTEEGSYDNMFYNCMRLVKTPIISATTLGNGCCSGMFYGCTSLATISSILPATTLANDCYMSMFYGCTSLATVPNDLLPATTLQPECYYAMFRGCTSLIETPDVLATTLADGCCQDMFRGCTSLTTAMDILPALTTKQNCYNSMFQGCTSLTTAPILPAQIPSDNDGSMSYAYMFKDCSNLNYIVCLTNNVKFDQYGYSDSTFGWVSAVASAGTFVKNASTNIWSSITAYGQGIPSGWTVVDDVTAQYRTISGTPYCDGYSKKVEVYSQISYDSGNTWSTTATSVSTIELYSEDCGYVPPSGETQYLTFIAQDNGTFTFSGNTGSSLSYSLDNGSTWSAPSSSFTTSTIQSGNKVLWKGTNSSIIGIFSSTGRYSVEGNAMSLLYGDNFVGQTNIPASSCFYNLFSGSTGLTSVENMVLPATSLQRACYYGMFSGCTALTTAMEILPFTGTVPQSAYGNMFYGCTSLTRAPELPGKLGSSSGSKNAYNRMFYGCSSLNYIKCLTTSVPSDDYGYPYCTSNWINGVAATGTFVKNASTTWPTGTKWVNGSIPDGWTVIDAT